ncbi:MAG: universal stress protein [Chloroflexota bacterium]
MYTNILVPLDGSTFAETALPHVSALAAKFGCKVTLVIIFETPQIYQFIDKTDGVLDDIHQAAIRQASDYLEGVKANLTAEGHSVEIKVIEGGHVAGLILEAIEESGADLVVMSTHGRSGLDRWRFGSVAQRVARHSPVPVVLIRPKTA